MANTDFTIQFTERHPDDVSNAAGPGKYRIFWNSLTGLLAAKDYVGNVTTIGGDGTFNFLHNPIVTWTPYTAAIRETVKIDPSGGAVILNLPTAVGQAGNRIKIINVTTDVTPITVTPFGGQLINGAPTYLMNTPRERLEVESDGTNWIVVG